MDCWDDWGAPLLLSSGEFRNQRENFLTGLAKAPLDSGTSFKITKVKFGQIREDFLIFVLFSHVVFHI